MRNVAAIRYQARPLPAGVVGAITCLFVALALARGISLTIKPGVEEQLRTHDEVGFFGVALAVAATTFLLALATRRHVIVWAAHALLISVYFAYGATLAVGCMKYGGGWDVVVAPFGAVVWHGLIPRLMRPLPPPPWMRGPGVTADPTGAAGLGEALCQNGPLGCISAAPFFAFLCLREFRRYREFDVQTYRQQIAELKADIATLTHEVEELRDAASEGGREAAAQRASLATENARYRLLLARHKINPDSVPFRLPQPPLPDEGPVTSDEP